MMETLMMEGKMGSWNDDRLDDLSRGMGDGFDKVDRRLSAATVR